jgi:hypothetical protein
MMKKITKYNLSQYNQAMKLKEQGLGSQRIAKILKIKSRNTVEGWINKGRKPYYFSEKRIAACNSKENVERMRAMNKITQPKAVEAARIKNTKPLKNNKLTSNFAYVLGVILGDGNSSQRRVILSATDKDFVLAFKSNLEKWSKYKSTFSSRRIKDDDKVKNRKLQWVCYLNSIEIEKFVNNFDYSKIKKNEHKAALVKGFFDSEGRFTEDYELLAYNSDKLLTDQISQYLTDLEIKNKISTYTVKNINGKEIQYNYLKVPGKSRYDFYQKVGFNIQRKQKELERWVLKIGQSKYGGKK